MSNNINKNEILEGMDILAFKKEILKELQAPKKRRRVAWGSAIVSGILGILAVVSLVQTWQIVSVYLHIKAGGASTVKAASGGDSLPSSLDNLPDMVGGC